MVNTWMTCVPRQRHPSGATNIEALEASRIRGHQMLVPSAVVMHLDRPCSAPDGHATWSRGCLPPPIPIGPSQRLWPLLHDRSCQPLAYNSPQLTDSDRSPILPSDSYRFYPASLIDSSRSPMLPSDSDIFYNLADPPLLDNSIRSPILPSVSDPF